MCGLLCQQKFLIRKYHYKVIYFEFFFFFLTPPPNGRQGQVLILVSLGKLMHTFLIAVAVCESNIGISLHKQIHKHCEKNTIFVGGLAFMLNELAVASFHSKTWTSNLRNWPFEGAKEDSCATKGSASLHLVHFVTYKGSNRHTDICTLDGIIALAIGIGWQVHPN